MRVPTFLVSALALSLVVSVSADAAAYEDGYNVANYDGNYEALDALDGYDELGYEEYDAFAYGADYQDPEYAGEGDLNSHYYGDEYDEYYDEYGQYGDQYGDDYFFENVERPTGDCVEDEHGNATLTNPACDVKVSGFDRVAKGKLEGGLDGKYKVAGCFQGRPKYRREGTPSQERTLWYSAMFSDWDISSGAEPNEADMLAYGGEAGEEMRPNFVPADRWHLHVPKIANPANASEEFQLVKVQVACVDGKELQQPEDEGIYQPLLTQEETEAKYRAVYTRYSKKDPDPTLNLTMVVFMVFIGVAVVLSIPYLMFKQKDSKGGKGKSFAQMLEESRKKRAGHTN